MAPASAEIPALRYDCQRRQKHNADKTKAASLSLLQGRRRCCEEMDDEETNHAQIKDGRACFLKDVQN